MFTGFSRCSCGAFSFFTEDGTVYSCHKDNFVEFLPEIDLSILEEYNPMYVCNWCSSNHFGLDLCACGSGEKVGVCKESHDCCGKPMQSLEHGYASVCAEGSFGYSPKGSIKAAVVSTKEDSTVEDGPPYAKATDSVAATIQQIRALNRKVKEMADMLMTQLISDIEKAICPGVKQLSTSPNCFIVNSNAVLGGRYHNLSPDYYSSIRQAQLVEQSLAAPAKSGLDAVFSRLEEMYLKKQVIVSKQTYMLNEQTLAVIADVLGLQK